MIYGYARVSTKEQNLDRQIVELQKYTDKIYSDKESGKDFERTNYKRLIRKIKPGDLLVIKSIDRLGRNYDMIIEERQKITKEIGADIKVLDMELLDTTRTEGLTGKFIADIVLQILSYVAEQERNNIKQRQAEGIRIAKQKGIKFGRPKINSELVDEAIQKYYSGEFTKWEEAWIYADVSRATLFSRVRELRELRRTNDKSKNSFKVSIAE